jgi:hypothetical protein
MTKTQLAEVIAYNTDLPKAQTYKAISAFEQQLPKPRPLVVIFKSNKTGPHQKFLPAAGFVWGK